ncbi:MAG: hypothetical protein HC837_09970 [Chloroflexaceae bacterium]|nr:hypothetical protein [Chloroflexaceae bacterium]
MMIASQPVAHQGLSEQDVLERRASGQSNAIDRQLSRSYTQILRENVFTFIHNVMFLLGVALIVLGRWSDALVTVGVILFNVVVSVVQEIRAKQMLDRLALLNRPTATVMREGREQTMDPGEIVVDDLLIVHAGDQIAVDGEIVGDGRIDVDESLLTGESELIPKQAGDPVYSGSFCVNGKALYQAQNVGQKSVAASMSSGARAFRRVLTPLQQQINMIIRILLLVALYFLLMFSIVTLADLLTEADEAFDLVQIVKVSVVIVGLVPSGVFADGVSGYSHAVHVA